MRIGINLLYLLPGIVGGTETYARSLLHAFAKTSPDNDYVVFVNREAADIALPEAPNFRRVVCPVNAQRRGARYAWEQTVLPKYVRREAVTLLHSLGYVGPLQPGCAHAVTIHDLNYLSPEVTMKPHKRLVLGRFVESVARRADAVITMSEFSKGEIVARLGLPAENVNVTHLAPGVRCQAADAVTRSDRPADGWRVDGPYIIAFGSLYQHKNIPALVRAFGRIAATVPHRLVIVGHLPEDSSVGEAISNSGVASRITTTGFVSDRDVDALLTGADLLVFPSLYEGFGLPLLDAQAAGVAVAASAAGSLPEIAGNSALLFDPRSDEDIAHALQQCALSAELRARLVRLGHANVAKFSWARTAAETLDVYDSVATAMVRQ
ncbi:MAG: glycosyltransferase family 4 protein [Gemmatimonadaceae bacterium]